jgi:hypothetical protein
MNLQHAKNVYGDDRGMYVSSAEYIYLYSKQKEIVWQPTSELFQTEFETLTEQQVEHAEQYTEHAEQQVTEVPSDIDPMLDFSSVGYTLLDNLPLERPLEQNELLEILEPILSKRRQLYSDTESNNSDSDNTNNTNENTNNIINNENMFNIELQ